MSASWIRWNKSSRRVIGRADGLSRDYEWPPYGVLHVNAEDVETVLTLPLQPFELVSEADARLGFAVNIDLSASTAACRKLLAEAAALIQADDPAQGGSGNEMRCPGHLWGIITQPGRASRVEVRCRYCAADWRKLNNQRVVVFHYFDARSGELLETKMYQDLAGEMMDAGQVADGINQIKVKRSKTGRVTAVVIPPDTDTNKEL